MYPLRSQLCKTHQRCHTGEGNKVAEKFHAGTQNEEMLGAVLYTYTCYRAQRSAINTLKYFC